MKTTKIFKPTEAPVDVGKTDKASAQGWDLSTSAAMRG